MRRLIAILLVMCMGVSIVGAWQIQSDRFQGTITFNPDGSGLAHVNGYPDMGFSWSQTSDNQFQANYWWYTVKYDYDPTTDTFYSPDHPGITLVNTTNQGV